MTSTPLCHFVFPGNPETRTGGYGYDRAIVAAVRDQGHRIETHALPDGFPYPNAEILATAETELSALPRNTVVIVDGLALGVLPDLAARLQHHNRLIALIHHPLADEAGIASSEQTRLFESERRALGCAEHVVVTSRFTAMRLRDFGISADRITVIEPGTEPRSPAVGSGSNDVHILVVATVTPRKGHLTLFDALSEIESEHWALNCVGDTTLAPDHAAAVFSAAERFGERVIFHGSLPEEALVPLYLATDLLVSPSHYEGYGMAIAEGVAHGLPVLASSGGAVPFTTGGSAAQLVPPNDAQALATHLQRLISDKTARQELARQSTQVKGSLPTWRDGARKLCQVIHKVAQS